MQRRTFLPLSGSVAAALLAPGHLAAPEMCVGLYNRNYSSTGQPTGT